VLGVVRRWTRLIAVGVADQLASRFRASCEDDPGFAIVFSHPAAATATSTVATMTTTVLRRLKAAAYFFGEAFISHLHQSPRTVLIQSSGDDVHPGVIWAIRL
jgi:hypothetical protein